MFLATNELLFHPGDLHTLIRPPFIHLTLLEHYLAFTPQFQKLFVHLVVLPQGFSVPLLLRVVLLLQLVISHLEMIVQLALSYQAVFEQTDLDNEVCVQVL